MGPMTECLYQLFIVIDCSKVGVPLLEVGVVWEQFLNVVVPWCAITLKNLRHTHL